MPSSDSTSQQAEAQLRQALEHMGGQRLSLASTSQGGSGRTGGSFAAPRHRYVRDGEVPVVHAALGRSAPRLDAALHQDRAVLDTLRQELDRERAAHEITERSLHDIRSVLISTQTRLAHVEMDLQAAKEAVQEVTDRAVQEARTAQEARAAHEVIEQQSLQTAPVAAAPTLIRRKPRAEKSMRAPQPVKWWVKVEKT